RLPGDRQPVFAVEDRLVRGGGRDGGEDENREGENPGAPFRHDTDHNARQWLERIARIDAYNRKYADFARPIIERLRALVPNESNVLPNWMSRVRPPFPAPIHDFGNLSRIHRGRKSRGLTSVSVRTRTRTRTRERPR